MSEKGSDTTPSLTPEEWANVIADGPEAVPGTIEDAAWHPNRDRLAAVMALANYALPDSHPAKITREDVEAILKCADFTGGPEGDQAELAARKLASILPPR